MSDIESRLSAIEERLTALEITANRNRAQSPAVDRQPAKTSHVAERSPADQQPSWGEIIAARQPFQWSVTRILGWGGGMALVLAVVYLIRLAIVGGWLTPTRQITAAVLLGFTLIAAGLKLRKTDREYASLLPAAGIVVLFLSVYGAHLYYGLTGATTAGVCVITVCVLSLFLCHIFASQLYALFAVIGSYSAPFLLGGNAAGIVNLVIYYSCWSIVFSTFAIWIGNRRVYLLALYLALVGFDLIWKMDASDNWPAVLVFQFAQLMIFSVCAVIYAARHNDPMTREVAIAHAPALLIFYALQYAVLEKHVPALAPWVAVISAGILLIVYRVARSFLARSLEGSRWLLAAYCALVLLHAGYLESVPHSMAPWVALLMVAAGACWLFLKADARWTKGPIGWVIGGIFAANYLRLVSDANLTDVPANELLLALYALLLYAGYYFSSRERSLADLAPMLVYAAHVAAMTAILHQFDNPFLVSFTWALLALGCLMLALRYDNKQLGKSSLLIFAVSAVKVFAWDISGAEPLVRIACLFALGISLYIGGWLYRKVETLGTTVDPR